MLTVVDTVDHIGECDDGVEMDSLESGAGFAESTTSDWEQGTHSDWEKENLERYPTNTDPQSDEYRSEKGISLNGTTIFEQLCRREDFFEALQEENVSKMIASYLYLEFNVQPCTKTDDETPQIGDIIEEYQGKPEAIRKCEVCLELDLIFGMRDSMWVCIQCYEAPHLCVQCDQVKSVFMMGVTFDGGLGVCTECEDTNKLEEMVQKVGSLPQKEIGVLDLHEEMELMQVIAMNFQLSNDPQVIIYSFFKLSFHCSDAFTDFFTQCVLHFVGEIGQLCELDVLELADELRENEIAQEQLARYCILS